MGCSPTTSCAPMMTGPTITLSSEPSANTAKEAGAPDDLADVQHDIMERACEIQAANDWLREIMAAYETPRTPGSRAGRAAVPACRVDDLRRSASVKARFSSDSSVAI